MSLRVLYQHCVLKRNDFVYRIDKCPYEHIKESKWDLCHSSLSVYIYELLYSQWCYKDMLICQIGIKLPITSTVAVTQYSSGTLGCTAACRADTSVRAETWSFLHLGGRHRGVHHDLSASVHMAGRIRGRCLPCLSSAVGNERLYLGGQCCRFQSRTSRIFLW